MRFWNAYRVALPLLGKLACNLLKPVGDNSDFFPGLLRCKH